MTIHLQLLGGLDIVGPDPASSAPARRRHPMMLLALVAASAPRAVSRDRVMAFLWPESDPERASNSLRQALHGLRRSLGEELFLPETASGLQLDNKKVHVDLWAFREAVARRNAAEAVAAYRGPFLDGFQLGRAPEFSHWIESERERVERDYRNALETLAREAETAAQYDEAVAWRRRLAAADPFSSRVALSLLKALTAAGDSPGALRHAAVHESLVRAHLEVDPDPAISEFVAVIRDAPPGDPGQRVRQLPVRTITPEQIQVLSPDIAPPPETGVALRAPAISAITVTGRSRARAPWLMVMVAFVLVGVGALGAVMAHKPPGNFIELSTGSAQQADRDAANRLIACEGPICPEGNLPQAAYVVPTHLEYTNPAKGTRFIAPAATGTTLRSPGYTCCSTAVFENEFVLPPAAVSATISITLLADNQAIVAINGTEFGRQDDPKAPWNYGGQPTTLATSFLPSPSGVNRLRVTLWDGGGAAGLNYRAFVTYDTREEAGGGE